MKSILCLLLLTISAHVFASKPNVVLLSSLKTPKIWYHSDSWKIEESLHKIFKNRFKSSDYNLVMKMDVDQIVLKEELQNPNNIAIFWVSHAKDNQQISNGISSNAAIVDIHGNDVKDLFKNIHPNIRFLGMVGCNARSLMNGYIEEGYYKNSTNLKIYSFDKKVDARSGLRKAIRKSAPQLGELKRRRPSHRSRTSPFYARVQSTQEILDSFESDRSCEKLHKGYPVVVTRTLEEDSPAVAVKIQEEILHLFPAGISGDVQEAIIYLKDQESITRNDLKMTVDTNKFTPSNKLYLGHFEFSMEWNGDWKIFAKKDGTPLGVSKNLYRYRGEYPSEEYIVEYQKYKCR